ncbi:MAG TPA: protein kinase [Bryobacteraceae bacterium]
MTQQVGRYQVVGNLGKGAMGVVYLAEDPLLNRKVAIKALDLSVDDTARRSFLHERLLRDARAAAGLAHPNIVSVYDVVEQNDAAYLVMEYVAGESLAQRLAAGPPPDQDFALGVLREMAAALDYTNARGIVHRDVKPANVMLDAQGTAKIMDFGIARISDARTSTPTGMVMGTLEYMAPEQVKGEPVDGRADQFALAAVAYEMLTGSTLFGEHSFTTLAYKIVNEIPPAARSRNPGLPAGVDEVLARALRKSPAERYANCGEFVATLERAFAGEVPPSGAPTRTMVMPSTTKTRGVGIIAGVIGVVVVAGGLWIWKPWAPKAIENGAPPSVPEVAAPGVPPAGKPGHAAVPSKTSQSKSEPHPVSARTQPPKHAEEPPSDPQPDQEAAGSSVPAPVLAAYNQGMDLFRAGSYPAAVEAFNRAIKLKPNYVPAYTGRAQSYMRQDLLDDAIKGLGEAISHSPRHPYAYSLRGQCYLRQQHDDLAFADFTRSLEMAPSAPAFNGRGVVYLNRNEYQRAIADFTAAIDKQPDYVIAYQNRRKAEIAAGDRPAARRDSKRIQELSGVKKSGQD